MEEKKKRNRRNRTKYPALKRNLNLKTRYDLIDYDYIDQLSDKEKEFLNNFTEEEIHANMKHKGELLNTTKEAQKACYDRNNARNRCLLTKVKARNMLVELEEAKEEVNNIEDELIAKIDSKED